jgi:hypothetical protein
MEWDAVGAIGEILGAVGVLASLIYLGVQIRRNSMQIWSQNVHAQTEQTQQLMMLQSNPELASMIERVYGKGETPTYRESILLESYLGTFLAQARDDFLHYQRGLIELSQWQRRLRSLKYWFDPQIARNWLDYAEEFYEADLVNEIRNTIANEGTSDIPSRIRGAQKDGSLSDE